MTERRRPSMIVGLRWEETSGVDHPANEEEGWAVMKSRRTIASDRPLLDMDVTHKAIEKQYTFGVVYKATEDKLDPDLDAHGEFIMADELQTAQWEYVKAGDRSIYLQHGAQGLVKVGEYVDIATWPYEAEVELSLPGRAKKTKTTIPAGSVWMGVIWNDIGWPMIKDGTLRGFSLGGFRQKTTKETRMTTPLEAEFEAFIANLKQRMPAQKFDALMGLLRVLVARDQDLGNPAGAGLKGRVAPTKEQLLQLIEDMRELDLSDEICIHVLRFMGGNPENPEYGESGVDESEVGKAVVATGLGEVITKLVAHAHKQHGRPLVSGLDTLVASGLDEEA